MLVVTIFTFELSALESELFTSWMSFVRTRGSTLLLLLCLFYDNIML
jgi:hypothetical protein